MDDLHSTAVIADDLESLDATFRPSKISVWPAEHRVRGIRVTYVKGEHKTHGPCDGEPNQSWNLRADGSEIITEVAIREGVDSNRKPFVISMALATSNCNFFDTAPKPASATTAATKSGEAGSKGAKTEDKSKLAEPVPPPEVTKTYS
ncbi:Fc.00g024220.m01.CDS01 [Cosmosporella sp. VM-42]